MTDEHIFLARQTEGRKIIANKLPSWAENMFICHLILQKGNYFFQKLGVNNISTVNSSKRPTSIRKDINHFAGAVK